MRTGVVQELDSHRDDRAAKHLSVPGTYVLVQKQAISSGPQGNEQTSAPETTYEYVPLLNNCHQLLPAYRVQRTAGGAPGETARKRPGVSRHKSQSPTGARSTKSRQAKERPTNRKR